MRQARRLSTISANHVDGKDARMPGMGRAMFVAILLVIAGVLNVIYGIGAVSNADFFDNTQYVFAHLNTWGWITIIIGAIQLVAGVSLLGAGAFGWVIGIFAASVGAVESLLSVGGTHPWWSLGIFAICLWVLSGLVQLGSERAATPSLLGAAGGRPAHRTGRRHAAHHHSGRAPSWTRSRCASE